MPPQREWFEKDYYQVLGVPGSATAREITKRYRQLARELHPDANPDDPVAEERFKEVSAAYDVIGDEAKRKEYDEARRLGASFGGGGGPGGFTFDASEMGDLGDLFGGLFGRGGGRGGPHASHGPGPRRGDDIEADLHLSFRDAVSGITTSVHLTGEATCSICLGSGARPGSTPVTCSHCDGRGFVDENQGFFSFSQPCPACGGRGTVITDPCPSCNGRGTEVHEREVKVRIPAGVDDGQRIRIKGRGTPGRNGGPPGDLYVRAHVAADPLFGRRGRDLTLTVPITFPEAALGTDLEVPTLDGDTVKLRIPSGTPTGKTFRVKNRGIANGRSSGHLLVTVEVAVPARLSKEEKKAVETVAQVMTASPREHLLAAAAAASARAKADAKAGASADATADASTTADEGGR